MPRRFKARPSAPRVGDLPVFEQTLKNGLRADPAPQAVTDRRLRPVLPGRLL